MRRIRLFALLLASLLLLGACQKEARVDFPELRARLSAADKRFRFPAEAAFFADGAYCVYCTLPGGETVLLTMREADDGKLDRVALTLAAADAGAAAEFADLALTLAACFIPDCDLAALRGQTGLDGPLFDETSQTYTQDRFTAVRFGSALAVCFFIERE